MTAGPGATDGPGGAPPGREPGGGVGPAGPGRGDDARAWRLALFVLAGAALLRGLLALAVPLFPDETYYWEWSRHPAASYYDHPPGIAALISLGAAVLGETRAGVRLGPALAALAGSLAVVAVARRLGGGRDALVAALALACMPLAAAGLLAATPDAPLLAAFAVGTWAVVRAVEARPRGTEETAWWALAGLALGAGLLSKYTAVLLPAGAAAGFALDPRLRRRLLSPGPWAATLLGLAAFSPVLAWNARLGWPSFAFQARHGLGTGTGGDAGALAAVLKALGREGELLAGQLGLVSPILFALLAVAVAGALRDGARGRGDPRRTVLAGIAAVAFGVFALSALRRSVEPNWPAPAYVAAVALLGSASRSAGRARWLRRGLGLGALLVGVVYLQALVPVLPVPPEDDPIADAHGWDGVAAAAAARAAALEAEGCRRAWVAANTYQEASELAFHLPGRPPGLSLNLFGRANQYDLWPGFRDRARPGDCLLFVGPDAESRRRVVAALAPAFAEARDLGPVERRRGDGVAQAMRTWGLVGWTGDRAPFRRD